MSSFRILHVDDDPLMRDIVELSLGLNPTFVLKTCTSGEEALTMAADWVPDLILCDVMMPDMEEPAVITRLRENTSTAKIPVIFMTARAQPPEIEQLTTLGAVAVIAKPFNPATLAETVRSHLQSIRLASAGYNFCRALAQRCGDPRNTPPVIAEPLGYFPDVGQSPVVRLQAGRGGRRVRPASREQIGVGARRSHHRAARRGRLRAILMRCLNVSSARNGSRHDGHK